MNLMQRRFSFDVRCNVMTLHHCLYEVVLTCVRWEIYRKSVSATPSRMSAFVVVVVQKTRGENQLALSYHVDTRLIVVEEERHTSTLATR